MRINLKLAMVGVAIVSAVSMTGCSAGKEGKKAEVAVEQKNESQDFNAEAHYDYPYYRDLTTMSGKSSDIVRGTLVKDEGIRDIKVTSTTSDDFIMEAYHVYRIKVEEVVKGNTNVGDEIEIRIPESEEIVKAEAEGLYFLKLYEDFNPYTMINPQQANLPIEDGAVQLTEETAVLFTGEEPVERSATGGSSKNIEVKNIPVEEAISSIQNAVNP